MDYPLGSKYYSDWALNIQSLMLIQKSYADFWLLSFLLMMIFSAFSEV